MSLFEQLGEQRLQQVVQEFYSRAVEDPLISHFFFKTDVDALIQKQIHFTRILLGDRSVPQSNTRSLKDVHAALGIRPVHFARRQKLMSEVLSDLHIETTLAQEWLKREAQLKALIIRSPKSCMD